MIKRARKFEPIIIDAASKHGVDARILWVIAYLETRFNPSLVSRKGARGMMQFMPDTARRLGLRKPHDPIAAIDAAAKYVSLLDKRFKRVDLVLAAYNSGETTVEAYLTGRSIKVGEQVINPKGVITGGIPLFRETRRYVTTGLRLLENLRRTRLFSAMPEDLTPVDLNARRSRAVGKSIRMSDQSDERPSTRRSIHFISSKEDP